MIHAYLVYRKFNERAEAIHDGLVIPMLHQNGLDITSFSVVEADKWRDQYYFTHPDTVTICFGEVAWSIATRQDIPAKFGTIRGTSTWMNNHRVVVTYEPEYVTENPGTFLDFQFDCTLPVKFPIPAGDNHIAVKTVLVDPTVAGVNLLYTICTRGSGLVAFDIETSGFSPMKDRILCISFGLNGHHSFVMTPECWDTPEKLAIVQKLFSDDKISWIAHNGKFDIRFIRYHLGVTPYLRHDTMLMHYTLDERLGTHGLKDLCSTRLALPDYEHELKRHLKSKKASYDTIPPAVLYEYAGRDTCFTLRLFHYLVREQIHHPKYTQLWELYNFLMEASNVLGDIESHGFVIDQKALAHAHTELTLQCERLIGEINKACEDQIDADESGLHAGWWAANKFKINPRSPKQIAYYLYDLMGYREVKLFKKGSPRSTSSEALEKHLRIHPNDALIKALLQYRSISKVLSTYVIAIMHAIDPDGRLRTDFKLHGTVTGRLSSSKPNLQNIPRPTKNAAAKLIRNMFTVDPGFTIVGADYSQAELRVAAYFAGEERMRQVWAEGRDMHTETCIDLYGPNFTKEARMVAKMLNFGVVYGRSAGSIAVERGIMMSEAIMLMEKFFATKPHLYKWLQEIRAKAEEEGELDTPTGRIRRFGLFTPQNTHRLLNQAANFRISSTASDCCLKAAIKMHYWCKKTGKGRVLLLVHDSIYTECRHEHAEEVQRVKEQFMLEAGIEILGGDWIPLKTDAHIAERWGEH